MSGRSGSKPKRLWRYVPPLWLVALAEREVERTARMVQRPAWALWRGHGYLREKRALVLWAARMTGLTSSLHLSRVLGCPRDSIRMSAAGVAAALAEAAE